MENLYLGALDAFLAKVRAEYDVVADQARQAYERRSQYNILGTNPLGNSLFTEMSNATSEGDRAVWRYTYTTAAQQAGLRHAGGQYPQTQFLKGYETEVFDPDNQIADSIVVAEERQVKEGSMYAGVLDRSTKLTLKVQNFDISDPFEVFNLAFTATASFPAAANNRFFGRGNKDGLNEPFISTVHARKDGGATQSNAVLSNGLFMAFGDTAFWSAREQAFAFKDDVGDPFPTMGGKVKLIAPNANSIIRTARELGWSEYRTQTANNEINIHQGEFGDIYSSPYLLQSSYNSSIANTKQWFIQDVDHRDPSVGAGLVCIKFVPFVSKVEWEQSIDSVVYKVKYEPVWGWVLWQNTLGSKGDGSSYTS